MQKIKYQTPQLEVILVLFNLAKKFLKETMLKMKCRTKSNNSKSSTPKVMLFIQIKFNK